MVSHFHYDPVWWSTQGQYTESRIFLPDADGSLPDSRTAFELVRLHLDAALSASLTEAVAPSGIPVSLTDREREVLALVAKGKSTKDIAAALFISERTARTHISHLLGKLGLESRMQLGIWGHANGFPLASADELARAAAGRRDLP